VAGALRAGVRESAAMRFEAFWRVAVVQAVAVAVAAIVLAVVFSHGFFEDWGWLVGPIVWLGCAALTARVVGIDRAFAMIGAVLAGLVSALAVVIGVHWLGIVVAIGLFAAWCARDSSEGAAWT
jgi:hypothetical protein